jgi:hypothetical protein
MKLRQVAKELAAIRSAIELADRDGMIEYHPIGQLMTGQALPRPLVDDGVVYIAIHARDAHSPAGRGRQRDRQTAVARWCSRRGHRDNAADCVGERRRPA